MSVSWLQNSLVGILILLGVGAGAFAYFHSNSEPRALPKADRVVVLKSDRKMMLYADDKILATYEISLGRNPVGHKTREGDSRTPEGKYVLDWRNPNSNFYRSIHVSYPNQQDTDRAAAAGVSPGGDIMIHGQPNGSGALSPLTQRVDWTDGCIAVSDTEMTEIWHAVDNGTPIEIRP